MRPNNNFHQVIKRIKKGRISGKLKRANRESSKRNIFFTPRNERKKFFIEDDHSFERFFPRNDSIFLFTDSSSVKMLPKRHLSMNKTCQNHLKNNLPIPATETQARIITPQI